MREWGEIREIGLKQVISFISSNIHNFGTKQVVPCMWGQLAGISPLFMTKCDGQVLSYVCILLAHGENDYMHVSCMCTGICMPFDKEHLKAPLPPRMDYTGIHLVCVDVISLLVAKLYPTPSLCPLVMSTNT